MLPALGRIQVVQYALNKYRPGYEIPERKERERGREEEREGERERERERQRKRERERDDE